jgi:ABC-type multidrug transport system fused ATPase/permease subunit
LIKVEQEPQAEKPKDGLENQEESQLSYKGSVFLRLFEYTKEKRCLFFVGIITCILAGGVHPGSALLLANILNQQFSIYQFSSSNTSPNLVEDHLNNAEDYVLGVFLLAIFIFFPFMIQSVLFTIVGEEITEKLRKEVYQKLLRLPVRWFEHKANRGGTAANRFGVDSRQVNSLATSLVSTLVMNFSSIIVGIILAFIFEWRLGLVGIVAMPCMVISGFISMLFYGGFGDDSKIYYEESSKISEEAILNIRTVYSCGYEARLAEIYDEKLQYPLDAAFGKGTKLGLLYGFSQLILLFTFGVLFYFGALIMRDNPDVSLLNIFYGIMTITWAGWYSGNNFYFMPDVVTGKQSAENLFMILDSEDEDQIQIKQNSQLLKTPIEGRIEFKNVTFSYDRTSEPTLNSISLLIKKG